MKKQDSRQRLFEVMSRLDNTFKPKLNEDLGFGGGQKSYAEIVNGFPGHARQSNPVDSPQYKWYVDVLNFIEGNNNVNEKSELVKKFQNEFLGLDYDVLQTPAEHVSWWLSPENQEFIRDELNSDGKVNDTF
jgi:hypothetical protein